LDVKLLAIFLISLSIAGAAQTPAGVDSDAEQEIFRLVNLERAKAGLNSLRLDPALQKAARAHSRIMADARQLSHEFGAEPRFDRRLALAGAAFDTSGENVAFNQTADAAHRGLMASPPHRQNILNPEFNAVGIGVVRAGNDIWVTQDFAREFDQQSPMEARNQVVAAFEQARAQAKLPPVTVADEPRLQTLACHMAKEGKLDTKTPLGWSTIRTATAYTETDVSHLSSTAMKLATDPTVRRIAVGVCFAKSEKYEAGMNWIAIAAY
jgi:Cysteine-rich secretory protein family